MGGRLITMKRMDLSLQVVALFLPWVFYLVFPGPDRLFFLGHLVTAYFATGVAQLVSCLVNWRQLPHEFRAKSRGAYEAVMFVMVAMGIIAMIFKSLLLLLMLLFYIVPIITVWYLVIIISELVKIRKLHGE
jgi:hypothetical protein